MKKTTSNSSKWLVIVTVAAVLCVAAGIFFYYNFFRQDNAKLIETVPDDAFFIFEVNDAAPFVKNVTKLSPYMNELFFMGSFAGFQSFLDKLPVSNTNKDAEIVVSGHIVQDKTVLLHSAVMTYWNFDKLLKVLQIDSRNCIEYDNNKIYQFGTHYRKYYFAWHHNIFSASESLDLLKRALKQHKHVKNLLFDDNFSKIFKIVEKNEKQNWLIVDYEEYLNNIKADLKAPYNYFVETESGHGRWAAYQVRFTENEIKMAGYIQTDSKLLEKELYAEKFPSDIIPQNTFACAVCAGAPQIYRFSLSRDTVVYNYAAFPIDSVSCRFEDFLPDGTTEDSCVKFKNRSVFKADIGKTKLLQNRYNTEFTVALEHGGYALFGDTLPALQYYITKLNQMQTVEDNTLYRFANQNLPSQCVYKELYFFNNDFVKSRFFAEDGALPQTSQKISVFGISFSTIKDGVSPTNIYLRF